MEERSAEERSERRNGVGGGTEWEEERSGEEWNGERQSNEELTGEERNGEERSGVQRQDT